MFSTLSQREIIILAMLNFSPANAFNLDQSKILLFGRELNIFKTHWEGHIFENIVGKKKRNGFKAKTYISQK